MSTFWQRAGLHLVGECACDVRAINTRKLGLCAELAECAGLEPDRAEAIRAEIDRAAGVRREPVQGRLL